MTAISDNHPAQTAYRRRSAELLRGYLQSARPNITIAYDGDRTVSLGPISVHYDTRDVEIRFPDPFTDDTADNVDLTVRVPGELTFSAVATVVEGLLAGWQVTS